jgi:hypothetical protein
VTVRRIDMIKVDSLDELKSAFAEWRSRKKHAREAMPEKLLARARRTAKKHGIAAVARVTRVERARLFRNRPTQMKAHEAMSTPKTPRELVPTFSRLELSAPSVSSSCPIAEVETGSGVTLRVFEQTPEMMGLLSAVCGFGGAR